MSSANFEPSTCASREMACRPAHASLSAARASSGRSVSCDAPPVSPLASAAKNSSAAGSGPLGFGVHAFSDADSDHDRQQARQTCCR